MFPKNLKNQDTYVYIDVSNIRSACLKTLGFRLDFIKLLAYLQAKYPNLRDVRYYEGIADTDVKKRRMFDCLEQKGYTICSLERKIYNSTESIRQQVKCPRCKNKWVVEYSRESKVMKSNVDVYLASDMHICASLADHPIRLILISCDGDYAEAIRNIIAFNQNVSITVLATPYVHDRNRNTLSTRLRKLCKEIEMSRYMLNDISNIRFLIEGPGRHCH